MSGIRVCLLGFGEVGQVLGHDLRAQVAQMSAWDRLFSDHDSGPSHAAQRHAGLAARDARHAVAEADLVISAVTAAQIGDAARSVAPHLKRGAYYFDLNSVSPAAKTQAASAVESAGGRFVEAAIMSPISPRRAASPMLLGGQHAEGFLPLAQELGFTGARVFSDKLGAASAAKMCRSVVVKGFEALMLESLMAARHHGVDAAVLDSLQSLFPVESWRDTSRYMISRALVHGRRRAEEMREVANTVAEAKIPARMSQACAEWQDWASNYPGAATHQHIDAMLDALRTSSERTP